MITKDKITEIFCIADDFCKEFESEIDKIGPPQSQPASVKLQNVFKNSHFGVEKFNFSLGLSFNFFCMDIILLSV